MTGVLAEIPDRVGSCLSVQALREDLDVAHTTVSRWLLAMIGAKSRHWGQADLKLYYLRDKDAHEVDFLVTPKK